MLIPLSVSLLVIATYFLVVQAAEPELTKIKTATDWIQCSTAKEQKKCSDAKKKVPNPKVFGDAVMGGPYCMCLKRDIKNEDDAWPELDSDKERICRLHSILMGKAHLLGMTGDGIDKKKVVATTDEVEIKSPISSRELLFSSALLRWNKDKKELVFECNGNVELGVSTQTYTMTDDRIHRDNAFEMKPSGVTEFKYSAKISKGIVSTEVVSSSEKCSMKIQKLDVELDKPSKDEKRPELLMTVLGGVDKVKEALIKSACKRFRKAVNFAFDKFGGKLKIGRWPGQPPLKPRVLIIDCEHYDYMRDRVGTVRDSQKAKDTFTKLGCEVILLKDPTKEEMLASLQDFACEDHSRYLVVILLAHGSDMGVYGRDCKPNDAIPISRLFKSFCQGAKGRRMDQILKWFIVTACRGSVLDNEIIEDARRRSSVKPRQKTSLLWVNTQWTFSTSQGFPSRRNKKTGTAFMQTLCGVLEERGTSTHLTGLSARINNGLVIKSQGLQYPEWRSTLCRDLYFSQSLHDEAYPNENAGLASLPDTTLMNCAAAAGVTGLLSASRQDKSLLMNHFMRFDASEAFWNFADPKGHVLIISNRDFDTGGKISQANSVKQEQDISKATETLRWIGYETTVTENLSRQQMQDALSNFAKKDHRNGSSLIVIILSHGANHEICCVDGRQVNTREIIAPFLCQSLVSTPKLFFIEACGGSFSDDSGQPVETRPPSTARGDYQVPLNTLICSAISEGGPCRRARKTVGTTFISAVCQTLRQDGCKLDILEMLCKVTHFLLTKVDSRPECAPVTTSTLTHKFYFYPGVFGNIADGDIVRPTTFEDYLRDSPTPNSIKQ